MALQLSVQRREEIATKLTQALQCFGQLTFESCSALAQTWLPVAGSEGRVALQTKGMPYNIIGPGDMLALFRCLSCKYNFSVDLQQMTLLGAPGRVFLSGETETSDNIQQCNVSIYLRVRDAQACRASSTVFMPVFAEEERSKAVAVLEVTQFNGRGMNYARIFQWARKYVEGVGLFMPASLESRSFEMQSHALSMKFFNSMASSPLNCILNSRSMDFPTTMHALEPAASSRAAAQPHVQKQEPKPPTFAPTQPQSQALKDTGAKADSSSSNGPASSVHEGDSEDESKRRADDDLWEPKNAVTNAHSRSGGLTKDDLERHFRYGLKAAAIRLGVCNTTLKRACRKHGILKWPRREILRKEKAEHKRSNTRAKAAAKAAEAAEAAALAASNRTPQTTTDPLTTPDFTGAPRPSMPQAPAPIGRSPFTDSIPAKQHSQPLTLQDIACLTSDWPAPPHLRHTDYQSLHDMEGPPIIPIDLSPESTQGAIDSYSIDWLPGVADIADNMKWHEMSPPIEKQRALPDAVSLPTFSRNSSVGLDNLFGEGFPDAMPSASLGDWCLSAVKGAAQDQEVEIHAAKPAAHGEHHVGKEPIKVEWMLNEAKNDSIWGL